MTIEVRGYCPVYVTIDTTTREVTAVHVADEAFEWCPTDADACEQEDGSVPSRRTIEKAKRIADTTDWPAWQFGDF